MVDKLVVGAFDKIVLLEWEFEWFKDR